MRSRPDARRVVTRGGGADRGAVGWTQRRSSRQSARGRERGQPRSRPRSRVRSRPSRADPNLATERTIKTLRWRESTPGEAVRQRRMARMDCRASFAGSNSRRACSCGAGPSCSPACWSSTSSASCARAACRAARTRSSHRRTCGIWTSGRRAFPPDIGAAARALWDRGEHRAALALLYRGMLSRLAHVHRVPIRDSSTEGDCLALAASHLTETTARLRVAPRARLAAVRLRRPGDPACGGARAVR